MEAIIRGVPDLTLMVLVVWEPVIVTDLGPPTTAVLGRVADRRAVQFWDPERRVSEEISRLARAHPERVPSEVRETLGEGAIVWDYVALFAPGTAWGEALLRPELDGYPVVDAAPRLRARLAAPGPGL